jgi:hypothetical protein
MQKKYLIANWVLFIIFSGLLGLAIKSQIINGGIFLNEAIAMLLLCISFPLKIYNIKVGRYIILIGLLVLLFNPLYYSYTITEGDTAVTYHESRFNSLISPLTFLVLMLFQAFNYSTMIDLYYLLTRGSEKEQKDELSRKIEFYYNKFNGCSNIELVDILKMYNNYPTEAQLDLKRIKEEKGIN